MKKVLLVLLILTVCVSSVFSLTACNIALDGENESGDQLDDVNDNVNQIKTKLEETKKAEKSSHDKTVSALNDEYEASIALLNAEDANDKAEMEKLKSDHEKALSDIESEAAAIDKDIADLKAEYAEKIEAAGGDPNEVMFVETVFVLIGNGSDQSIDDILAEYREKLDKLEGDKEKNKERKEKLIKDYNERLGELEKKIAKNAEDIKKCKESFDKRIADIEAKYESKIAEIDALLAELFNQNDMIGEKLKEIESKLEMLVPTVKKYSVKFTTGTNEVFENAEVEHGNKITQPNDPTRVGYVFMGWYYQDIEWSFLGYSATEDMELVAKWEPAAYTITVNNYYEDGSSLVIDYNIESEDITLEAKEHPGYTFKGWSEDGSEDVLESVVIPTGSYGDKVFTAQHEYYEHEWWELLTYDTTDLRFQMTNCTNGGQLSSGCEKYLGGSGTYENQIDDIVAMRNEAAYINTKVNVTYIYVADEPSLFGYSQNINRIYEETANKTKTTPDMYCNYLSDLFCSSLLGSFTNVHSVTQGKNDYYGKNYFDFTDDGYMTNYMNSLSVDGQKNYVIISDYFIDVLRAFYVVPVNVELYNEIAKYAIDDLNEDGVKDIGDLFCEIEAIGWNYSRIAEYSTKIYEVGADLGYGEDLSDGKIVFALGNDSISASAVVYTSYADMIMNVSDSTDKNLYTYGECSDLLDLADTLRNLMGLSGIVCYSDADAESDGESGAVLGIRKNFSENKVLFGGATLLGALEDPIYQNMKKENSSGFVVAPMPTNGNCNEYNTQIHALGCAGAIAACSSKFVQCSAFLQYQSSNSEDVRKAYCDQYFTYDTSSGLDKNIDMIEMMRTHAQDGSDMYLDEAINFFYEDNQSRWHSYIAAANYSVDNMMEIIDNLHYTKSTGLDRIKELYESLDWMS